MYEPIRPEAGRKLLKANQVRFGGFWHWGLGWIGLVTVPQGLLVVGY